MVLFEHEVSFLADAFRWVSGSPDSVDARGALLGFYIDRVEIRTGEGDLFGHLEFDGTDWSFMAEERRSGDAIPF